MPTEEKSWRPLSSLGKLIRNRGVMIAAGLEVTAGGYATYADLAQIIAQKTVATGDLAVAAFLCLATIGEIIALAPVAAVEDPKAPIKDPIERARVERQISLRNKIIKISSGFEFVAAICYLVGGICLANPWIMMAGALYIPAAAIRFSGYEGEGTPPPFPKFNKGDSFSKKIKQFVGYSKTMLQRHPNIPAEALLFPGLVFSCIGLLSILPPVTAVLAITGLMAASACRAITKNLQKIPSDKITASHIPSDPQEHREIVARPLIPH